MRRVAIDMQNKLFADAIAQTLHRFDSDFQVYTSDDPSQTANLCIDWQADILIMEVTSYLPWKIEERRKIRDFVKGQNPDCKIVLVVDEKVEKKLADSVRQAKKDKLIDNFIYGSISSTYLSAVIDTL